MKLSIITPAYNRAHTLDVAYNSLCSQTCKNFEWIIVDDGSTDNTEQVCNSFTSATFDFNYIKKENGGKHTAVNRGVKAANGEFLLILDSDDSIPANSVETILKYCEQIEDDKSFGGVAGYMAHHDGEIIGHGCERRVIDTNAIDIRFRYHLQGDMCEVYRTKVLRENPFPEVEGEKFCPEALVWNRIARHYRLRYFPEVVYYRDYLDGGLTDNIIKIRMKSPVLACRCYAEQCKLTIPFVYKIKSAINYWRFKLCVSSQKDTPNIGWYWLWVYPLAVVFHHRDKKKTGL